MEAKADERASACRANRFYDHLQHRTSRPHAASSGCLPAKWNLLLAALPIPRHCFFLPVRLQYSTARNNLETAFRTWEQNVFIISLYGPTSVVRHHSITAWRLAIDLNSSFDCWNSLLGIAPHNDVS